MNGARGQRERRGFEEHREEVTSGHTLGNEQYDAVGLADGSS